MLHVYTGDGKGKTTAATGLTIRFAGSGKRVCIFQFLKDGTSSELCILQNAGIRVIPCQVETKGFFWTMEDEEKEKLKKETCRNFLNVKDCADKFDMIVLDELAGVISDKLVEKEEVIRFISEYSRKREIVITGRNIPQEIIDMADYVSEIKCVKHPFYQGHMAQKGIEY